MSDTAAGPSLKLDSARHIDQVCNRFEAAWKNDPRPPRLEEFLSGAGPDRGPLLEELIALDLHYRRLRGEQPQPDEYQGRFPDLQAAHLSDAFFYPPPEAGAPTSAEVFAVLRRYTLKQELGCGRRHAVFLVEDAERRPQVLKALRGKAAIGEKCLEKLRTVAGLRHPCLLPLSEVGEEGDLVFVVSPFCEGTLLSDWLRHNLRPDPQLMAALAACLVDGVQQLHQLGVSHGRIHASNVLLAPREASVDVPASLPFVPKLLGGLDADFASAAEDVQQLGALLYELLIGQPPESEPPPLSQMRRDIPPALETICLRSLRPRERGGYGSAREFAADLARFLAGGSRRAVWWLLGAGAAAAALALVLRWVL